MHTRSMSATLLALTIVTGARVPVARAAWPRDPATNLPVSVSAGHDVAPAINVDGADGVIVAWNDNRNGSDDIYVQRINGKGVALWTANGVALCTAAGAQQAAAVASDGAGGAIVTWHDTRNGANNDVYAQRVNAAGVVLWTANGVAISTAANWQTAPQIAADGFGGAIITWFDNRTGDDDVYAQRINSAGTVQWTANGVPLCTVAGSQNYPKLVSDGAGGAVVIWRDWRRYQDSDVFAQRVNAAGVPQWTSNGVDMSAASNLWRYEPVLISDGSGGAIATWMDDRTSNRDIYVQRVSGAGALQWGSGVRLGGTTSSGWSAQPKIASDGAGGAIVTWRELPGSDYEIYAGRVSAAGVRLWTVNGVPVCALAGSNQENPDLVPDGLGGAIIAWQDARAGSADVFAQRINGSGVTQWTSTGLPVTSAPGDQLYPVIAADSRGGAIVAWQDFRSAGTYDVYAQRIERFGRLGAPEPEISWVRDVPAEQGGHVRIRWNASYLDTFPSLLVRDYGIWRQVASSSATAAQARSGSTVDDASPRTRGAIRAITMAGQTTYWEGLGSIPARGEPWYTFVAETFQDSTAGNNPFSVFMIDAHAGSEAAFWSSVSDSGYSVDNLPPTGPSLFTSDFSAGSTHLTWAANQENDLEGYRLHRGASSSFVPGPGNLIAAPTTTSFDDPGPNGSFYKLAATDTHGNVSTYTLAAPTTGVPDLAAGRLELGRPTPNPARDVAQLSFVLPAPATVTLTIHDAGGRLVRRLLDGPVAPGIHEIRWDARDETGALAASGVYFIRLGLAGGPELTRRLALTH